MRMLVVGTGPAAIEQAERTLVDAGHDVARCHDSGAPAFPCRALSGSSGCPLEEGPIDVAVTLRNRALSGPSPFEAGATCAIRRHIPLVVAGVTGGEPFSPWCSQIVEDPAEFVEVCEAVATVPAPGPSAEARRAVSLVLAAHDRHAEARATVWRQQGRLQAKITVPASCSDLKSTMAARVIGALRSFDEFATIVDVMVTTEP